MREGGTAIQVGNAGPMDIGGGLKSGRKRSTKHSRSGNSRKAPPTNTSHAGLAANLGVDFAIEIVSARVNKRQGRRRWLSG